MSEDLIITKQFDGEQGRSSRKRIEMLSYVDLGPGNGGMLIDVSEGGISFQGVKPLETGELLSIGFKLPTINDFIRVTGQVVWLNDSGKGGGLRFVELPQTAVHLIKEWVGPQSMSRVRTEKIPAYSRADKTNQSESSPALPMMAKRDGPSSKANRSVSEPLRDFFFPPSTTTDAAKVSGSMVMSPGLKDSTSTSGLPGPTVKTERRITIRGITLFALGIFVSLATVAVFGAILYRSHRGKVLSASNARTESVSDLSLGLKLERSGKDWQIGWSRNADVVVKAIGGHLSIADGHNRKELDLDPGELRSGSIVYTPVTDSLVVQLQVVGGNSAPPVSESVRVLAGIARALSPETRTQESLAGKSTESKLQASSTFPSVAGGLEGKQAPTVPGETLATSVETDPRKFEKMMGNVRPARPITSATSRATEFEAPTIAIPVQPESGPNASAFVLAPKPPEPPASLSPRRESKVDPPQLIERKDPVYPDAARQLRISGSVELNFHISADGRVNQVNVVKGNAFLAKAAVDAVQLWRYKPSRINGIPIESQSSVVIVFQPK